MDPHMFGKPGEGIHARRFMGVAFWDLFMTVVAAIILAHYMKWNAMTTFAALFAVGELAHWWVGVDTAVMRAIRGKSCSDKK